MALDRDWERFRGGPRRRARDRMHVTLNPNSIISLNPTAHSALGRPEAVHLYFNPKKDSIALSPAASPRLNDAFPLKEKGYGCYVIYASPFCQNFGIRVDAVQEFVGADIDSEGNLVLDLSTTVTVKRPRRRKKP